MKAIIFLALLLSFSLLMGNYVENQPFEHTQPDGTKLSLYVSGDEYYHRVHDANGYTILLDRETGYAVFAEPDGNSIKASGNVVGTVDPAALGIQPNLFKQDPAIEQRWKQQQVWRDAGAKGSPTGLLNNIVGFVRFNDQTNFPTTPSFTSYYNNFMSTSQQSLADLYDEVSSGALDINSYLYPGAGTGGYPMSFQVAHDRGYYSPYSATNTIGYTSDSQGQDRMWYLVQELLGMIDDYIPAGLDLDNDNDGIIDALTFIFRGLTDSWGDILWPAHWTWGGSLGTLNGASVTHYVFDFEGSTPPTGVSVISHEMGHMIGFPDLYHYTSNGITPVASWSLMASDNAQHELVYEKLKYGTWLSSIPTITASSTPTEYTLTAIDQNPYSAYKIASNTANQFYVVEYRRDTGRYESGIPGSGLIVYRIIDYYPLVGGTDVRGNASGPPDEIYVYRPGGDIDTNGSYNSANFSSTVGRTKIYTNADPEPWLYTNTTTQFDGNLCITDVGASGGTTITFILRDSPPNIWDGSTSTAWATASNWSLNHVPTASEDVEIPSYIARYPIVVDSRSCRSLLVKSGASVTINTGTLTVANDYTNYGILAMNDLAGNLWVQRDLLFESGSSTNITENAEIYVQSDVEFRAGSSVNMTFGYLEFYGTGNSYFRTYVASAVNHLRSDKDSPYVAGFSALCEASTTINGNFWTYAGSTSTHPYSGTTIIKGSLYSNYDGSLVNFGNGTVSFEGTGSSSIAFAYAGNYLNNLRVNKSTGVSVYLSYPTIAEGSFTLQSGIFNPSSNTFTVGGSWTNSVGVAAFTEGSGTVVLNGTGTQTISTETFNILQLNKSSGTMTIPTGATVTVASYDWVAGAYTVSGGIFTVADLADSGVMGTITMTSGTINYTQDTGQYVDLRCVLTMSGGTFNIYGGSSSSWFGYVDPCTINMSAGTLDIKNQAIYINTSYACNENITGGTIRTSGYFTCSRTDFTPSGGTLEMYGTADMSINCAAGSNLYTLRIDKQATSREAPRAEAEYITERDGSLIPITRSNTVSLTTALQVNNSVTVATGSLNINGQTLTINNDLYIYGTLIMTTAGTLDVNDDVNWYSTSVSNVTMGNIYCGGNWYFANGCTVDLTGSTTTLDGYYGANLTDYSPTAQFGHLVINLTEEDPETTFVYSTDPTLLVNGNLTVNATNTLNLVEGVCLVTGNTVINATGGIIVGDGGTLTINGSLSLNGSLVTGPGTAIVHGDFTSTSTGLLDVNYGIFRNDIAWDASATYVVNLYCGLNIVNGVLEITDKSVSVRAHATRVFNNATFKVGVGFSATAASAYQPTGGGLYLIGGHSPALDITGGNWASNLYIQKGSSANGVYMQNALIVTGDLTITGGKLYTNNYALSVGGNWTNSVGSTAFVPGTGTVTFNKAGDLQTITGSNNFYNVTDNHTGAALSFEGATTVSGTLTVNNIVTFHAANTLGNVLNNSTGAILAFYYNYSTSIASYDGGGALRAYNNHHVTIADMVDSGFYGSYIADSGHLEFHQDATGWVDLNGSVSITNNGIFDIYGGTAGCYIAYAGNCTLTINSGEFNVWNNGVYVSSTSYTRDFVISGGTMRIGGSFYDSAGGFDPTGGTLEMVGAADNSVTVHSASWLWTLKVNKVSTRESLDPVIVTDRFGNSNTVTRSCNLSIGACTVKGGILVEAANIVYLSGDVNSINAGTITVNSGTLGLNGYVLYSTGNVVVNGVLELSPASSLQMSNGKSITVNNGGSLMSLGSDVTAAMITHNASGYYGLNVESGATIGATYTIFEYMNANGVYIKSGAMVDPTNSLDYCTFRLGASGGRLLWINNSQSFTVDGASFPTNTWSGAYNVSKTVDSGIVYFSNWSGNFGGPAYEQDTYGHVYWEGTGVPPITDLDIQYIPASSSVQLTWTYPLAATSYKIYRSTNPYGTFTYYTSTTGTTWSQTVPGPYYFYRVTAVVP
jgi:M6 family metalloprotease-like protein